MNDQVTRRSTPPERTGTDVRFSDLETFVLFKATPLPTDDVLDSFTELADDEYLEGSFIFRKRAFARGVLSPDGIEWVPETDFFQPRQTNAYAGDIRRVFASAGNAIRNYIWQVLQGPSYRKGLGEGRYHFGLHQLRIVCDDLHKGYPVPEGYHQDGFDFVGLHSFQRANVDGGTSYLREGGKDGPCIHEHDLGHGEILVFNDRRLYHYASPVVSKRAGPGHRDICVLTFSQMR